MAFPVRSSCPTNALRCYRQLREGGPILSRLGGALQLPRVRQPPPHDTKDEPARAATGVDGEYGACF